MRPRLQDIVASGGTLNVAEPREANGAAEAPADRARTMTCGDTKDAAL